MKTTDIKPGQFYRAKIYGRNTEVIRIERVGEPAYPGDQAVFEGTRFLGKGTITIRKAARDILKPEEPDAKLRRIIALIDAQA